MICNSIYSLCNYCYLVEAFAMVKEKGNFKALEEPVQTFAKRLLKKSLKNLRVPLEKEQNQKNYYRLKRRVARIIEKRALAKNLSTQAKLEFLKRRSKKIEELITKYEWVK